MRVRSDLFAVALLAGVTTACWPLGRSPLQADTDDTAVDTSDTSDTFDTGETGSVASNVPVARCEAAVTEVTVGEFTEVHVEGADSYDPLGHAIETFTWTLTPPPDSRGLIQPEGPSARRLQTDVVGAYVVTLVITTDDGRQSEPCEATVDALPPPDGLVVELSWAISADDLDLHLVAPGGYVTGQLDCYYGNMTPDWGAPGGQDDPVLVAQDTADKGPEVIAYAAPLSGSYTVVVSDYPGHVVDTPNEATVTIILGGSTQTFTRTVTTEGEAYAIATIAWPSGDIVVCPSTGC